MTVVSRRYGFYSEQVVTRDPATVRVYLGLTPLLHQISDSLKNHQRWVIRPFGRANAMTVALDARSAGHTVDADPEPTGELSN